MGFEERRRRGQVTVSSPSSLKRLMPVQCCAMFSQLAEGWPMPAGYIQVGALASTIRSSCIKLPASGNSLKYIAKRNQNALLPLSRASVSAVSHCGQRTRCREPASVPYISIQNKCQRVKRVSTSGIGVLKLERMVVILSKSFNNTSSVNLPRKVRPLQWQPGRCVCLFLAMHPAQKGILNTTGMNVVQQNYLNTPCR